MAKDYARGFYNSKAWKDTQAAYMASRNYLCERCGNAARIVHHVRYITPENIGNPAFTLDWANLEALCIDCHNQEHIGTYNRAVFDQDGNLIAVQQEQKESGL